MKLSTPIIFYLTIPSKPPLFLNCTTGFIGEMPVSTRSLIKLKNIEDEFREQELLGQLVYGLLDQKIKTWKDSSRLKVAKPATREEIERRLHLATDLMHAHFDKNLSLDDLSQVSCLSKFHFIRLFKAYFHESPHQFITRIRLEKSISYLKSSGYGVKEIALKVGIENASSFSRLFRNHFGVYPTQFAQA